MAFSCFLLVLTLLPTVVYSWQYCGLRPGSLQYNRGAHGAERRRGAWVPLARRSRNHHLQHTSRHRDTNPRHPCTSGPLSAGGDEDAMFTGPNGEEWIDDGRDSLPFEIYDAAPPPRKIGTAKLPPLTSSGDTLWHGAKHYKVLRVSSHYKYEGGRFVVRKKKIQAKELNRVAREQVAARLVYGKGSHPPPQREL